MGAYWVDIAAVAFFVVEWLAYGFTLEHTAYGRDSLSARMNRYREVWVRNMLDREARTEVVEFDGIGLLDPLINRIF